MAEEINEPNGVINFRTEHDVVIMAQGEDKIYIMQDNIHALITALQTLNKENK